MKKFEKFGIQASMVWSFSVIFLEFTQFLNNVVLFLFLLVVLKFDECVEQNIE